MKAVKPVQSVLFQAYYSHYVTIISIICTIILIISNLEIAIRVRIHSRKLAIWNIHQRVSSFIIKHPSALSNGDHWSNRPSRIGLTDVLHPTSTHCRFELVTQCINRLGNGCALVLPDVISNSEIQTNLQNNGYN